MINKLIQIIVLICLAIKIKTSTDSREILIKAFNLTNSNGANITFNCTFDNTIVTEKSKSVSMVTYSKENFLLNMLINNTFVMLSVPKLRRKFIPTNGIYCYSNGTCENFVANCKINKI